MNLTERSGHRVTSKPWKSVEVIIAEWNSSSLELASLRLLQFAKRMTGDQRLLHRPPVAQLGRASER